MRTPPVALDKHAISCQPHHTVGSPATPLLIYSRLGPLAVRAPGLAEHGNKVLRDELLSGLFGGHCVFWAGRLAGDFGTYGGRVWKAGVNENGLGASVFGALAWFE